MTRSRREPAGFTLLELVVAATVLTIVVTFVYQLLTNTVRGQDMVRRGLEAPKVQNTILGQIMRDLRYVWWPNFAGNTGFLGQNRTVSGKDGDRMDFVTCRRTRLARLEDASSTDPGESPVTEVGYACRPNEAVSEWIELWRREDFFVDDNPVEGGTYGRVYDKLRRFDLTYYPNPQELAPGEKGVEEWDSRLRKGIPYAIVVQIEFDIGDPPTRDRERDPEKITRIILLRGGAEDSKPWDSAEEPATPPAAPPGGRPPRGR